VFGREGALFLELGCSHSVSTDLWRMNYQARNVNTIRAQQEHEHRLQPNSNSRKLCDRFLSAITVAFLTREGKPLQ
jgi:hypothetical protein